MVGWGDWVPHGPLETSIKVRGRYEGSLPLDGVLSSVGWHGSVLKLSGESPLTAREPAAVKYLFLVSHGPWKELMVACGFQGREIWRACSSSLFLPYMLTSGH